MDDSSLELSSDAPVRQIGTKFSGPLSRLISDGAQPSQRPAIDYSSCCLNLAMNVLHFCDTVILNHSPNGCLDESFITAYLMGKLKGMEQQNPYMYDLRNIHCCSTGFGENDVIFGGEEKLKQAILQAHRRYKPRMICVMASCVSAIIGDDIESVCEQAAETIGDGTYVIPFHTQGFQSHAWINYADRIWQPLIDRVMKPQDRMDDDLVNFFRPVNMSAEDVDEMERLMDAMALRVNVLPDYQSVESLESAPEAILNTGLCKGYHQPIFQRMHQHFKTPFTQAPYPLGIGFTEQWLREIGQLTDRQDLAEALIRQELQRITPELEKLRRRLKGKTVVVAANHAKTPAFIQACTDLGLKITAAFTHMSDESLNIEYESLQAEAGDIDIHVGSPMWEQVAFVNRTKPDICLTHPETSAIAATFGFPAKSTYLYNFQNAHFGFQGVIVIGRRLLRGMKNPIAKNLLKYAANTSGRDWRSSPFLNNCPDPFKFAKGGGKCGGNGCGCSQR